MKLMIAATLISLTALSAPAAFAESAVSEARERLQTLFDGQKKTTPKGQKLATTRTTGTVFSTDARRSFHQDRKDRLTYGR